MSVRRVIERFGPVQVSNEKFYCCPFCEHMPDGATVKLCADHAYKSRAHIDPPNMERCAQTITLRDGTQARCGRRFVDLGPWCKQHRTINQRNARAAARKG